MYRHDYLILHSRLSSFHAALATCNPVSLSPHLAHQDGWNPTTHVGTTHYYGVHDVEFVQLTSYR